MSTHSTIHGLLNVVGVTGLVGTRIYHYEALETATAPYIVFDVVTESNHNLLDGGRVGRTIRASIRCFAVSATAAEALGDAVETALKGSGYIVFRQTFRDAEAKLYWTQIDWSARLAAA